MKKKYKQGYNSDDSVGEAMTTNTNGLYVKETIQDVAQYSYMAVPERYLSKESAELFGIRSSVSELDGRTITASYFPYYNKQGELVAYKKRDWTVPKEDKERHFSVVGNMGIAVQMFGQQNLKPNGNKKLYITEGEEDAVALHKALVDSLIGGKYEGKIIPSVISIPLGTANAVESFAHNDDFIKSFPEIVLAFDNDYCTPKELKNKILKGKEATEAVAAYLLSDNIYTIPYPSNCKDSRECLVKGYSKDLARIASFNLIKYSPESICSGVDADLDDLIEPLKEGFYVERFPLLMEKLHGFREHELTTYAAFSGVGKSTLSREIAWELIRAKQKVGMIFLEEPLKKTQQSLLALELGVKLSVFRENPLQHATREQIQTAKENVLSNGNVFFLNHFGSLKVDKLMQQIKYLHFICGCTQIFIDHISMVVAGSESNNERKDIDMLYEELATFMTVNPVGIHAVMHLKRVEDIEPKQKDGEEPKSYWRTVKKEMLRGSSGAEQMSSQIVVLENEVLPDGRRGRVRIKVEKNREHSHLGICDWLLMNEQGRLETVPTDPEWIFNYYKEQNLSKVSFTENEY